MYLLQMSFVRASFVSLFCACLTLSISVRAEIRKNIQEVVNPYGFVSAKISPDAKRVALIRFNGYTHDLVLFDIATRESRVIKQSSREEDGFWIIRKQPRKIFWINDQMLAVDYGALAESIDLDGKKIAKLAESKFGLSFLGKVNPNSLSSTEIYIKLGGDDDPIMIVDAATGRNTKLDLPDEGRIVDWAFDRHGKIRLLTLRSAKRRWDEAITTQWYKTPDTGIWQKIESFRTNEDAWEPLFVLDEPNSVIVSSRHGRDTKAVFGYDIKEKRYTELMAGHPTQDILHVSGLSSSHFESVATNGMKPQQVWFDSTWMAWQASVDQAIPNSINVLTGDPKSNILVFSSSDIDPGRWSILETSTLKLIEIGKGRVTVQSQNMRRKSIFDYKSIDGLTIPAYLTHPDNLSFDELNGQIKPVARPMIVLIHGGPVSRNHWEWDAEVQLLANEGYLVFQPQFRGSSGFGKKFEIAGYGQWGLLMQDDITAGVQYLIERGWADPKRICIYGASYGGYAATWGLVKTPQLYRCAISFAGVSDIEYMLDDSSDSNANPYAREFMRFSVGDKELDKAKFEQVSPLKHAGKISAPILIMHGEDDERVPISHSKKLVRALEKHKKVFQWVEFQDEGHGVRYIHNEVRYYTTLLDFLQKHLQTAPSSESK